MRSAQDDEDFRSFHVRDVLRFMEHHGEWWFALRAQKQIDELRAVLRRLEAPKQLARTPRISELPLMPARIGGGYREGAVLAASLAG